MLKMPIKMTYLVLGILGSFAANSFSDTLLPEIEGVFGVAPVTNSSIFAFWVPLDEGEAVSGVQWYNNDGSVIFPEFLAVAGDYGHPELLEHATSIGENIVGASSDWCYHQFSQSIASDSSGLYFLVRLPEGADFEFSGNNGGAGIGYLPGESINKCWISGDGENWDPLAINFQMAIIPEMSQNKNGQLLVLSKPDEESSQTNQLNRPNAPISIFLKTFPNPFNPKVEIRFVLSNAGKVDIAVFDVRGRLVQRLFQGEKAAGEHATSWDGRDLNGRHSSSGVYLVKLKSGNMVASSRITLMK